MSLARNALAALAATGLALTPLAAQAAPVRTATPVEEADGFVGNWVILALLIGALVPVAILLASDSEAEAAPASP